MNKNFLKSCEQVDMVIDSLRTIGLSLPVKYSKVNKMSNYLIKQSGFAKSQQKETGSMIYCNEFGNNTCKQRVYRLMDKNISNLIDFKFNEKDTTRSKWYPGKVCNMRGPAPRRNYDNKIIITRKSGSGFKTESFKKRNHTRGDGIKHESTPLPEQNFPPPLPTEDVYKLWVDCGCKGSLGEFMVEEGFAFVNAKERKSYAKCYGQYNRNKLLAFRRGEFQYNCEDEFDMFASVDQQPEFVNVVPKYIDYMVDEVQSIALREFVLECQGDNDFDDEPRGGVYDVNLELLDQAIKDIEVKHQQEVEFEARCVQFGTHYVSWRLGDSKAVERCVEEFCDVPRPLLVSYAVRTVKLLNIGDPVEDTLNAILDQAEVTTHFDVINFARRLSLSETHMLTPLMLFVAQVWNLRKSKQAFNVPLVVQGAVQSLQQASNLVDEVQTRLPMMDETVKRVNSVLDSVAGIVGTVDMETNPIKKSVDFLTHFIKTLDWKELVALVGKNFAVVSMSNHKLTTFMLELLDLLHHAYSRTTLGVELEQAKTKLISTVRKAHGSARIVAAQTESLVDMEACIKDPNMKKQYTLALCKIHDECAKLISLKTQGLTDFLQHPLLQLSAITPDVLKSMRGFNTIAAFIKNATSMTQSVLASIPNAIFELLGLIHDSFISVDSRFKHYIEQANPVVSAFVANPNSIFSHDLQFYLDLWEVGNDLMLRARSSMMKGTTHLILSKTQRTLQDIIALHRDQTQLAFQRLNPYGIRLVGPPGCGKSEVAKKIAATIHTWIDDERFKGNDTLKAMGVKRSTYSLQSHLDYMDGYSKEGVIIIDEAGSKTDGSDVQNLLTMLSANTFVCPMATLDNPVIGKKGTTFTSHTVIACTNCPTFQHLSSTYANVDALERRFNVTAVVESVGPMKPDFSHLRFRVDYLNMTLPQFLYYIKEHEKFGFINHFSTRASINYDPCEVEPIDFATGDVICQGVGIDTMFALVNTIIFSYELAHLKNSILLGLQLNDVIKRLFNVVVSGFTLYGLVSNMDEKQQLQKSNGRMRLLLSDYIGDQAYDDEALDRLLYGPFVSEMLAESFSSPNHNVTRIRRQAQGMSFPSHKEKDDHLLELSKLRNYIRVEYRDKFDDVFKQISLIPVAVHIPTEIENVNDFKRVAQGGIDLNAQQIEVKLSSHVVGCMHYKDSRLVQATCGVPLHSINYVVPSHLLEGFNEASTLVVVWFGGKTKQEFKFDEVNIKKLGNDIAVIKLTTLKWRCANFHRNFIRKDELSLLKESRCTLVACQDAETGFAYLHSTKCRPIDTPASYINDSVKDKTSYRITSGLEYAAATRRGDCGAPLVIHGAEYAHKIVGMHVAGASSYDYGLATLLVYEDFESDNMSLEPISCVAMGKLIAFGLPEQPLYIPRTSSFIRTEIRGLPVAKVPALLNTYKVGDEYIDPVFEALAKYQRNLDDLPFMPDKIKRRIFSHWEFKFAKSNYTTFSELGNNDMLTFETSLRGFDKLKGLNLKTSPGYPYVLDSRKSDYIKLDEFGEYHVTNEVIRDDVMSLLNESTVGVPQITWIITPKDELRPVEKRADIRLFEIAPMHFTIAGRMLFGQFINFYLNKGSEFYSAVGINPESVQWVELYNRMRKNGTIGPNADWKKFDTTIRDKLIMMVIELINKWYAIKFDNIDDKWNKARLNFGRAMAHRTVLLGSLVFHVSHGNPSGNFLTTIINTMSNAILMQMYWLQYAPIQIRSMSWFDNNTTLVCYGDDLMWTVSPLITDYGFDMNTLKEFSYSIGMKITSAHKNDDDILAELDSFNFLKRGFARDYRNVIVARLDWSSMAGMINWVRKSKFGTPTESLKVNMRVFSQYLYFYGREVYEHWCKELNLDVPDWEYYDDMYLGGFDITDKFDL